MAQIALAIGGAALGVATFGAAPIFAGAALAAITPGAIGGVIGGTLGGVLDSQYLFPALFGKGNAGISGPRINDLQISSAAEGTPMSWVTGGKNRVAGQIIWVGPLQAVETKQSAGGKGGGLGGGSSQSVKTTSYFIDFAIAFCEGEINAFRRIWADAKLIYDNITTGKADTSMYESVVGYTGSDSQGPDPTIEAVVGSGNTPAYRGTAYLVFKKFDVTGGMPQAFQAYIEQEDAQTLATGVARVMNRAGRVQDVDYNVDLLPGKIKGLLIADNQQGVSAALEALLLGYNLGVQEDATGQLVFFPYSQATPIEIDNRDLAAHEQGDEAPPQLDVTDQTSVNLPSEVVVNYFDLDNFFQQGGQRAIQINKVTTNVDTISVPLTLSATEAKTLSFQLLWLAWSQRQIVSFSLPPSYLGQIAESDIIKVAYEGTDFLIKLNTLDRGNNYLINCTGTFYDPDVLDQTVTTIPILDGTTTQDFSGGGGGSTPPDPAVYSPPQMLLIVADIAPLTENEVEHNGLYWAGATDTFGAQYRGSELYSTEGSTDPNDVAPLSAQATIGKASSALGSVPAVDCWDRASTVTIVLSHGTLASTTADQVINGKNWALIGSEIIGFVNATLTDTNTYELSLLLRGRRNSQYYTDGHASGDRFLLLDPSAISTVNHLNASDVGQAFVFQLPSAGMDLSDVASDGEVDLTYTAQFLTPFRPAHLWGRRDAGGNLTIYWIRCTRAITSFIPGQVVPLAEDSEKYLLEIYNGSTLKQSIPISWEGTDVPNWYYSAAAQTGDGFTPFTSAISARIYQISEAVGNGLPYEATL